MVDENLAKAYCPLLELVFGMNATMITDHFGDGCKDPEWILGMGKMNPKPIYFGCDLNISKKHFEREALKSVGGIPAIIATEGFVSEKFDRQAWKVIRHLPDFVDAVREKPQRMIAANFRTGKYEVIQIS